MDVSIEQSTKDDGRKLDIRIVASGKQHEVLALADIVGQVVRRAQSGHPRPWMTRGMPPAFLMCPECREEMELEIPGDLACANLTRSQHLERSPLCRAVLGTYE